jgi:hypothetical protein
VPSHDYMQDAASPINNLYCCSHCWLWSGMLYPIQKLVSCL